MSKLIDLTGEKFGRLFVLEMLDERGKYGEVRYLCKCECGNTHIAKASDLRSGSTKSCGCLNAELIRRRKPNLKHGMTGTRIHECWSSMRIRCYNKNRWYYKDYGGRGITVCDDWMGEDGFINFYKWAMANGYTDELTLDRIDVNGNYCPENCRWATYKEQGNNRRTNRFIESKGCVRTISEWAEITGKSTQVISDRIKSGWSIDDAIWKPTRPKRKNGEARLNTHIN